MQAYLAYKKKKVREINNIRTAYEYKIEQMGWFNCDKYREEELFNFKGTIVDADGKPVNWVRVHLLSEQEQIHVSTIVEEGGKFSFRFPKNMPFEIYASRKDAEVKKQYDGSSS